MRWSGIKNGQLLRRAALEFDIFLTVDQSIEYQQRPPPDLAIITMIASSNKIEDLRPLVPLVLAALAAINPGQTVRVGD
jgi:hypothetical protein